MHLSQITRPAAEVALTIQGHARRRPIGPGEACRDHCTVAQGTRRRLLAFDNPVPSRPAQAARRGSSSPAGSCSGQTTRDVPMGVDEISLDCGWRQNIPPGPWLFFI